MKLLYADTPTIRPPTLAEQNFSLSYEPVITEIDNQIKTEALVTISNCIPADLNVALSSLDPTIATVDDDGTVHCVADGTVRIKGTALHLQRKKVISIPVRFSPAFTLTADPDPFFAPVPDMTGNYYEVGTFDGHPYYKRLAPIPSYVFHDSYYWICSYLLESGQYYNTFNNYDTDWSTLLARSLYTGYLYVNWI